MRCSWGSGKVENNKFIRNYNTFYFCCPPNRFIYTHLPSDDLSKWSLINKNITQDQFENLLYKDKYFNFYGFNDIEPGDGIVKLKNKNSVEVKFENLKDIKNLRLSCKIIYENKFLAENHQKILMVKMVIKKFIIVCDHKKAFYIHNQTLELFN